MSKTSYYDAIFQDIEGSKLYLDWIESKLAPSSKILEMACGTGDLAFMLSKEYDLDAFDIDESVILAAKAKYPDIKDKFFVGDFLNPPMDKKYDAVICINDSLNYILNEEDLDRFVDSSTQVADQMFLDSHHPYRLLEFTETYLEEGRIKDFDYSYQISGQDDFLVHIINFLDGNFESVFQWVFDPQVLIDKYKNKGFKVDVYTDFKYKGLQKQGEKIMYHVYKEDSL